MRLRVACLVLLSLGLAAVPAPASAAPSLKLRAHEIGLVDRAGTFDRHYLAYQHSDGLLRVIDDRTGTRYDHRLPPTCSFKTARFPEALLGCKDQEGRTAYAAGRPRILDLRSGALSDPAGHSGVDSYGLLGRQWVAGTFDTFEPHVPTGRVYLNRATGDRREAPIADRLLDLDSPTLAPVPIRRPACRGPQRALVDPAARRWLRFGGPRRQWLFLERCGRPPRLISRCRVSCFGSVLASRVVAIPGDQTVTIVAIRSSRRSTFRFPRYRGQPHFIHTMATSRRVLIELTRPHREQAPYTDRLVEIRLPPHLR